MRERTEFRKSPFIAGWEKLPVPGNNYTTTDSVVGTIVSPVSGEKFVVKWCKQKVASPYEAKAMGTFLRQSIDLYEKALGKEHIVPSSLILGAKTDGNNDKHKLFLVQPYIEGWTGKTLPEELRSNPILVQAWKELFRRLSRLYNAAYQVNNQFNQDSPEAFPINLTVGNSRRKALDGGNASFIPDTPNIIISPDLRLHLFDFGAYTQWDQQMEPTYEQIKKIATDISPFIPQQQLRSRTKGLIYAAAD